MGNVTSSFLMTWIQFRHCKTNRRDTSQVKRSISCSLHCDQTTHKIPVISVMYLVTIVLIAINHAANAAMSYSAIAALYCSHWSRFNNVSQLLRFPVIIVHFKSCCHSRSHVAAASRSSRIVVTLRSIAVVYSSHCIIFAVSLTIRVW